MYEVTFEQIFVDDKKSELPNGQFVYDFVLIRDSKDAPWLISRMGQF